MPLNRLVTTVLVGFLALVSTAEAQSGALVTPGDRVRLETRDYHRLEGVVTSAGRDLIQHDQDQDLAVAVQSIRHASVRGRATGTGALIGGVAGLAAGVAYGLLITRPESSPCDADNCTRAGVVTVSGLIGAAAGAGLGAIVGSLIPRGKQVQ